MTTKQQILTDIEVLAQQTERTFFYPALKAMKKSVLLDRLEAITGIIGSEKRRDAIISASGLTGQDLLTIAVFGTSDKIENEIVIANKVIGELVDQFEAIA